MRLRMCAAYSTASPQNDTGNRLAKIIARAMFNIARCIRPTFPLNAWLRALLICRATPVDLQKRSTIAYSPPLSVRRTWMRQSIDVQRTRKSVQISLQLCFLSKRRASGSIWTCDPQNRRGTGFQVDPLRSLDP